MEEGMGECRHGKFDLRKGCPKCIAEKKAEAEVNSPENIKKRVEAVQPKEEVSPTPTYRCPNDCQFQLVSDDCTGHPEVGGCSKEEELPENTTLEAEGDYPQCPLYKPRELFPAMAEPTAVIKVDPGTAPSFVKHLESAQRIVAIAASREIITEADAKAANDDLNVMAELRKAVDEERKSFTVPLNDHLAAINGAYKLITGPLMEADQITRRLLTDYKVEQQRKADEAKKLNQDAIDLARRQAEANNGEFTVETKPVPVPFAPKLTRTDQGKSGLVDHWKFRVVDLEKLPREYMVPDEAMLNSIAQKQHDKKQVPGVEFYNEPGLRVTR